MFDISDPVFLSLLSQGAIPIWGFLNPTSGTTNLPTSLTINGTPVEASLYYSASTATTSSWVPAAGETLPIAGNGDDVVISETISPFTDGTPAARIAASGKYYQGADGYSSADLGTDDFVFVAAIRGNQSSNGNYIFKRADAGATTVGWSLRKSATTIIRFSINDGTNTVDRTFSVVDGQWNIIVVTCDRDESASADSLRVSLNGVNVTTSIASAVGNVDTTSPLTIGAYSDDTNINTADISFLGMWKGAGLFAGGAANRVEMDRIAMEISYKLMGAYPAYNAGAMVTGVTPRASSAYLHKDVAGDQYAFPVGNNWIRVGNVGLGKPIGIVHERGATNLCLRSSELSASPWVQTNITTALNTSISIAALSTASDSNDTIRTDATNGEHNLTQSCNYNLAAYRYVFSGYASAINRDWVYANMFDGYAGYDCYFDLTNGVVGASPGVNLTEYGIELARTSDNLYRWWIAAAIPGAVAGYYTVKFGVASADGYLEFAEVSQTNAVYAGNFQLESVPYTTSNMRPTTAYPSAANALTRSNDIIYYQLDTDNHPGDDLPRTIVCNNYSDELRSIHSGRYHFNITTGTGSPQYSGQRATTNFANSQGYNAATALQWNLTGTAINVNTSETNTARLTAETDNIKLYINGTQDPVTTDTSATVHSANRIYVGNASASGSGITTGVTTKLLIYDEIIAPGERGTGDDT